MSFGFIKEQAMAEKRYYFKSHKDEQPMATESINLSGDKKRNYTSSSSTDHYLAGIHSYSYDAINELKTSHHEQKSVAHCRLPQLTPTEISTTSSTNLDNMQPLYRSSQTEVSTTTTYS